jgi:hypothetical protein
VADHGQFGGWGAPCSHACQYALSRADKGLVVYGDNVLAYGLCIEHVADGPFLEWRGKDGRVYGHMSELAYCNPTGVMNNPVIHVADSASDFITRVAAIYTFDFGCGTNKAAPCIKVDNATSHVDPPGYINVPCTTPVCGAYTCTERNPGKCSDHVHAVQAQGKSCADSAAQVIKECKECEGGGGDGGCASCTNAVCV